MKTTGTREAGALVLAVLLAACGGDSGSTGSDAGGGSDAAMDTGAARDAGGTDGGGGGGGDACVSTSAPLLDPETLPPCPSCSAGGAHCVPAVLVPGELRDQLADCDPETECVPDLFVLTNGRFLLPTCRSLSDAEGRCLSVCVPQVAEQADRLPQATCAESERCVPCFDPTTGVETGACGLACDPGPAEPPVSFERCCGGIGSCVPLDAVPADQASQLGRDTCSGEAALCAPDALVAGDPPVACRSLADAEGRCLPECLPAVQGQLDLLPVSSCAAGERCVPCFDPTSGEDTQACHQNGDMPTEPPTTFERCCSGAGSCVPASVVPPAEAAQLGRDTCGDAAALCAPDELVGATAPPPSCRSVGDAEGRCLPACLPAVAAQADRLPRATCAEAHLCTPCYDPLSGEDTGACRLNGDAPAEPPSTFDTCCSGLGSCVPRGLVPADQLDDLGRDTCADADALCAPRTLSDGTTHPATCRSIADAEGRCLPACLPAVAAQADRLPRSTCPEAHLCTPCYDPLSGADSGACRLNGDVPAEPATTFERCCGGIGACVPRSLVPADDAAQLGRDTCGSTDALCAPDELQEPTFRPPTCRSIADVEGRCLPACLPAIASQADRLPTCSPQHLCAPCFDPIDGTDTGACRQNGDMPTEPAYTFPGCCTRGSVDRGRCVPESTLPPERASGLPQDDCSAGDLCVPNPFLDDPAYHFPTCITGGLLGGDPGACVPDCMVGFFQGLFLTRSTCAAGEQCAPCIDPLSGSDTGACG